MAYDDALAARIRRALAGDADIAEKRMFGGIAFLHRGRMFAGVADTALMACVGPDGYAEALNREHVREMDFTGRPMRGYVFVDAPGLRTDAQLREWLQRCRRFLETLPEKAPK